MTMKFLKTIIALALALCFLQSAGGQELRTRSRLIKENAELRSRVDSLIRELEAYRLEKSGNSKVDALLLQLYRNHKHTVVTRKVFLRECGALKGWLRGK